MPEVPRAEPRRRPLPFTFDPSTGNVEWSTPYVEEEVPTPPPPPPTEVLTATSARAMDSSLRERVSAETFWSSTIADYIAPSRFRTVEVQAQAAEVFPMERCLSCRNKVGTAELNRDRLCVTCAPNFSKCQRCTSLLRAEEIYDYRSSKVCWSCVNPIMNYTTNVINVKNWRSRSRSELYYGVELEVSVPKGNLRKHAMHAHQLVEDFAIIKSDSSVDNGFEIVSVPAKPSKVAAIWEPFFKGAAKGLVGYRGNCGMHVHVTRTALPTETIRKLSVFLNSKDNIRLIEFASSRHLNHYCKQNPYITVDSPISLKAQDRYSILNTTRSDTIEFRSFKSTMKFDHFQRNLEFVGASIEFCGLHSVDDLKYTNFIKFVSAGKKYPRLKKAVSRWFRHLNTQTKQLPFLTTAGLPSTGVGF